MAVGDDHIDNAIINQLKGNKLGQIIVPADSQTFVHCNCYCEIFISDNN